MKWTRKVLCGSKRADFIAPPSRYERGTRGVHVEPGSSALSTGWPQRHQRDAGNKRRGWIVYRDGDSTNNSRT